MPFWSSQRFAIDTMSEHTTVHCPEMLAGVMLAWLATRVARAVMVARVWNSMLAGYACEVGLGGGREVRVGTDGMVLW
jgi:hypothetical protein